MPLRALVTKSIAAKLDQVEYSAKSVHGIKGAIRAANTSLSKNLLPDVIIEKLELLLVSNNKLHRACHRDYRQLLQSVQDKGVYANWKPETLEILNSDVAKRSAVPLAAIPAIDLRRVMEMHSVRSYARPQRSHNSEIALLLKDIERYNQTNPSILELAEPNGVLRQCHDQVERAKTCDAIVFKQGNIVSKWSKEDISKWADAVRSNPEIANNAKMLPEMLAVTSRAILLTTDYSPRAVQILSVMMMNISSARGKLMQIATGEGKSTTTAMLAVINALKGKQVDIVTSSSLLATRDADEWHDFYSMFHISSSNNITERYSRGPKACYKQDIVYGDTLHFQSDLLRDEHKLLGTRNNRSFANSVVLIDEVDSMLIDDSGKIAKLATPIASMEYLAPIFVATFSYLNQMISYFNEEVKKGGSDLNSRMPWIEENLTEYIEKLAGSSSQLNSVEQMSVPPHLQEFVEQQAPIWAKSALRALTMSAKRDYLVIESEGKQVIAPVDYRSTGVVQVKTNWMNGLHQFLQIKHNLAMSSEGLTTSFISNMAYFKRYGDQIFGMSGTLGSKGEQELLQRVYDVDVAFVPTFKLKKFTELPGIVADSSDQWHHEIVENVRAQSAARRATLILAETIEDVEKIEEVLVKHGISQQKIHTYATGAAAESKEVLEKKAMIGDVIVATNIAGRGTDIKTSRAVEAAGGLHVCLTFLPSNLRVEDQAFGRTARQGNPGTGQLIINGPYEALKLFNVPGENQAQAHLSDIDILKQRRDSGEALRIRDIENNLLPKIKLEDQMFAGFSHLSHAMKSYEDNSYKQRQLEEHWGLWFKRVSTVSSAEKEHGADRHAEILAQFSEFIAEMTDRYKDGNAIMRNPVYLTQEAVNKFGKHNSYDESVALLEQAIGLAGEYGFAAHYNRAYALFRQNGENLKKNSVHCINGGIKHLNNALMQLEGVIIPQLHMMQILIGEDSNSSPLSMQVATKLNLHKLQAEYIRNALAKIESGLSRNRIIVVGDSKPVFELLGQSPSNPSEEVLELTRYGTMQLFTLDAKKPPVDKAGAIGMGVLGISQFVVGALVTVCSGGAATALGVSMLMSGAQDLYHGTRAFMGKETINWGDYWVSKGISYAISVVAMGWDNFKAGLKAVQEQAGRVVEAGKNFLRHTASSVMGREAATQIATTAAREGATTSFTSIASEFVAQNGMSRVAIEIGKSIAVQNLTDIAAKEIAGSLSDTKEDIREDAYNKIMHTLTSEPTATSLNHLMAIDRINGNNHYALEVKKAAQELLAPKIDMLTSLATKLSTAALNGMASRSGNVFASVGMKAATISFEMGQAASQIQRLIGDFCDDLRGKIVEIEQSAMSTVPEIMHQRMRSRFLDKKDIGAIVEILKMNQVVRADNMQFDSELLEPTSSFEAGLEFPQLRSPQVENPLVLAGTLVNPPSFREVQQFQLECLKQNNSNEAKNIEEIDL